MQTKDLLLCLGVLLTRHCACAQGTLTFQDLDFEKAQIIIIGYPALISVTNAYPGWTVLANGVPINEVQQNSVLFDGAGILDNGGDLPPLDGKFSALLAGPGLSSVPMGIEQPGTIPVGSESLTFFAGGTFSVSFAGHPLTLEVLGYGPNNSLLYGADISAYAGTYGEILFQTGNFSSVGLNVLDDITFSPQPIPEPGVISMLGLGTLIFGLRRSRSAVQAQAPPPSSSESEGQRCCNRMSGSGPCDYWMWFYQQAFGSLNYENTPVGAVTHTDEPSLDGVNLPKIYLGLWAAGKNAAICGWAARQTQTPHFQAVGDPFVTR